MPQLTPKRTGTTTPAAESKIKCEPTITIKWAIPRLRSELQLATINNANYLLKQVENRTVVKVSNRKEYDLFLKRCIDRKIPLFTDAVDAKKPPRIVLFGLPNCPVEEVRQALAELNIKPEDIKTMKIRSSRYLEHSNFPKGSITVSSLQEIKAVNNVIERWT
jgi:hypothetical protein